MQHQITSETLSSLLPFIHYLFHSDLYVMFCCTSVWVRDMVRCYHRETSVNIPLPHYHTKQGHMICLPYSLLRETRMWIVHTIYGRALIWILPFYSP